MNIYYCKHCKRICFTFPVDSSLVCCGDEMTLLKPKTAEEGNEKHLPVIEKIAENKIGVKVGAIQHPMLENHYIQWIFVTNGERYQIQQLKPGDVPAAEFFVDFDKEIKVFEFCNIHGLWMAKYE